MTDHIDKLTAQVRGTLIADDKAMLRQIISQADEEEADIDAVALGLQVSSNALLAVLSDVIDLFPDGPCCEPLRVSVQMLQFVAALTDEAGTMLKAGVR